MSYLRKKLPQYIWTEEQFNQALAGIGFNLFGAANFEANIEDTIYFASIRGMENDDLRVLSMTVLWLERHHARLNAARITDILLAEKKPRVLVFWAAVAYWLKDRRFARLNSLYQGADVELLRTGNSFQISRNGEDQRFIGGPLKVPDKILRSRLTDIFTAEQLAAKHNTYRWRLIAGPHFRSDMIAELEQHPELTATELARRSYGSFATAWQVKQDLELVSL